MPIVMMSGIPGNKVLLVNSDDAATVLTRGDGAVGEANATIDDVSPEVCKACVALIGESVGLFRTVYVGLLVGG